MATNVLTRVERLEAAGDGGGCPRCGGVIEVRGCGGSWSATKHGKRLTAEEYRKFKDEEDEEGVCPVCGEKGDEVSVRWPEDRPNGTR